MQKISSAAVRSLADARSPRISSVEVAFPEHHYGQRELIQALEAAIDGVPAPANAASVDPAKFMARLVALAGPALRQPEVRGAPVRSAQGHAKEAVVPLRSESIIGAVVEIETSERGVFVITLRGSCDGEPTRVVLQWDPNADRDPQLVRHGMNTYHLEMDEQSRAFVADALHGAYGNPDDLLKTIRAYPPLCAMQVRVWNDREKEERNAIIHPNH